MEDIEIGYKRATKYFSSVVARVEFDIERSKFHFSNQALYRCSKKIDGILEYLQLSVSNYYISQILTRTLFEHYLTGHYIWTKLRFDKNDKCGEDYYKDYFIAEWFKQKNYYLSIENIKMNNKEKINLERLKKKYPDFKDLDQIELEKINKTSNQFDIRKIGIYLKNQTPENDPYFLSHTAMLEFLDRYNELSSFIHGGPTAEKMTYDKNSKIDLDFICNENIQWGMLASRHIKENLIFILCTEFYNPYDSYIEKLYDISKKN